MKVSFLILIRVLLPYFFRKEARLKFLGVFAAKADECMSRLTEIKDNALRVLNITGQTLRLERHLSEVFNAPVVIAHTSELALNVGLEEDGPFVYAAVGLDEIEGFLSIALQGENTAALDFDYQVIIPSTVSVPQLIGELNKYRLAGKKYQIIIQ